MYFKFKSRLIQKLLGFFSISAVLFVFQACYGTPQDLEADVMIEGSVKNKTNLTPIPGLKVNVTNTNQSTYTLSDGTFTIYVPALDTFHIQITDEDGNTNGAFKVFDTAVSPQNQMLKVDVLMEEN